MHILSPTCVLHLNSCDKLRFCTAVSFVASQSSNINNVLIFFVKVVERGDIRQYCCGLHFCIFRRTIRRSHDNKTFKWFSCCLMLQKNIYNKIFFPPRFLIPSKHNVKGWGRHPIERPRGFSHDSWNPLSLFFITWMPDNLMDVGSNFVLLLLI